MKFIIAIAIIALVGCSVLSGPYATIGPIDRSYKDIITTAKAVLVKEGFRVTLVDEEDGYLETAWDILPISSLTVRKRERVLMTFEKQEKSGYIVGVKVPTEEAKEGSSYWLPDERDAGREERILYLLKAKLMEVKLDD